jgi:hypothetical protein
MATPSDSSDSGAEQFSRLSDGEQATAMRKYPSAPNLKGPGKPPKIPNRLPRIQSNLASTSSDFQHGTSTAAGAKKETAMQWVDRLLAKARSMKAEMADQRQAVAVMRSDIHEEYRLAGVPDPAQADGQSNAHLHIEASFAPIINVPVMPAEPTRRGGGLQSEVEYHTHEL